MSSTNETVSFTRSSNMPIHYKAYASALTTGVTSTLQAPPSVKKTPLLLPQARWSYNQVKEHWSKLIKSLLKVGPLFGDDPTFNPPVSLSYEDYRRMARKVTDEMWDRYNMEMMDADSQKTELKKLSEKNTGPKSKSRKARRKSNKRDREANAKAEEEKRTKLKQMEDQAKHTKTIARNEELVACASILWNRNLGNGSHTKVDLHDLPRYYAKRLVKFYIGVARITNLRHKFEFITGKGDDELHGTPKIKTMLTALLDKKGIKYDYAQDPNGYPNEGVIVFRLNGDEDFAFSDDSTGTAMDL